MSYSLNELRLKIAFSIEKLFQNDYILLQNEVGERSINHKLAEYIQEEFLDLNVDCEYNRKGNARKELENIRNCAKNKETNFIYPDIIVHKRTIDDFNILVIEIKSNRSKTNCDILKLEFFTSEKGNYAYNYGLFIKFDKNPNATLRWFKNGKEIT